MSCIANSKLLCNDGYQTRWGTTASEIVPCPMCNQAEWRKWAAAWKVEKKPAKAEQQELLSGQVQYPG